MVCQLTADGVASSFAAVARGFNVQSAIGRHPHSTWQLTALCAHCANGFYCRLPCLAVAHYNVISSYHLSALRFTYMRDGARKLLLTHVRRCGGHAMEMMQTFNWNWQSVPLTLPHSPQFFLVHFLNEDRAHQRRPAKLSVTHSHYSWNWANACNASDADKIQGSANTAATVWQATCHSGRITFASRKTRALLLSKRLIYYFWPEKH